jgi:uncharacterized membrane protein (DUF4010 family)
MDPTDASGMGAASAGMLVALGIGLLVGLERERAKGSGPARKPAGVRTFALLCIAGAISGLIGSAGIVVAGGFVVLAVIVGYWRGKDPDPGLTTEVAMLATFLLGILAMRAAALAAGLGVMVAIILASKNRLHRLSKRLLTEQELHDLLILAGAAFVILPLLPDRTIDPWQAINPYRLWVLVVAVMSVSSLGYLALRAFGSRVGLAIAGLAGGFVSSTATIAAMAERARRTPSVAATAASAGLMSNVATIIQLAVVLAALSPPLVALAAAALSSWRSFGSPVDAGTFAGKRPFEPMAVLRFVGMLAAIILLAGILRSALGKESLVWVMALSGLADVHAAAAAAAQATASGHADLDQAALGLLAAFMANSLLKCMIALVKGGMAYAIRLVPGIAAMMAAFAALMLADYASI